MEVGQILYLTQRLSCHLSLLSPVPEKKLGTTVNHAPVSFRRMTLYLSTCVSSDVIVFNVSSASAMFIVRCYGLAVHKTSWCLFIYHSSSLMSTLSGGLLYFLVLMVWQFFDGRVSDVYDSLFDR